MNLYGETKCPACKMDMEDHPSLIERCEELQQVKKFWHGCLNEIRDLRIKISELENKIKEYQDNM